MAILLPTSLDQYSLSEQQIEAIAKEGYLTVTDFLLIQYLDIDKLQALTTQEGAYISERPSFTS